MSKAISSRTPETNQEAIEQFHKAFRNRRVEVGEVLMLPDVGQLYEVVGHKFWKKKDSKFYTVNLVFETQCTVCDEPFEIIAHRNFKGLARTCKAHRGMWKNPTRQSRSRAAKNPRSTPHHDAVRSVLDAYSLIEDRVGLKDVVARAIAILPRNSGTRDTRRQSVQRAIKVMKLRGTLGCTLEGDYFVF